MRKTDSNKTMSNISYDKSKCFIRNFIRNRLGKLFRIYIYVLRFIGKLSKRVVKKKFKDYRRQFFTYLRARAVPEWKFMNYWNEKDKRTEHISYQAFGKFSYSSTSEEE